MSSETMEIMFRMISESQPRQSNKKRKSRATVGKRLHNKIKRKRKLAKSASQQQTTSPKASSELHQAELYQADPVVDDGKSEEQHPLASVINPLGRGEKAAVIETQESLDKDLDDVLQQTRLEGNPVYLDMDDPNQRLRSPFEFKKGCFRQIGGEAGDTYSGITRILHACFYKDWTMYQVSAMVREEERILRERGLDHRSPVERFMQDGKTLASLATKVAVLNSRASTKQKMMAQGTAVDDQCTAMFSGKKLKPIRWQVCFSQKEAKTHIRLLHKWNIDVRLVPVYKIHPLTWLYLHYMDDLGLRPVCAQTIVGCDDLKIATQIDHLWVNPETQKLTLVELKTWNKITYFKSTGKMHKPFNKRRNHPANQHQLQLALTLYLLQKTFDIQVDEAMVVRVGLDGVTPYPLKRWAMHHKAVNEMLSRVQKYMRYIKAVKNKGASREQRWLASELEQCEAKQNWAKGINEEFSEEESCASKLSQTPPQLVFQEPRFPQPRVVS